MAIAVVTDSTCDLPEDIAKSLNIEVVPLYVRFGEEVYRDRIDVAPESFFEMLLARDEFPTTSQPTAGDFLEVYQRLAKKYTTIVSIHISEKLSGTYASAITAKKSMTESHPNVQVEVVDSSTVSGGLGLVVVEAALAVQDGQSVERVLEITHKALKRSELFVLGDTVTYLVKGGRIGKAAGMLGKFLNLKPLVKVLDGEAAPVARATSRKRAIDILKEKVGECGPIEKMYTVYSTDRASAEVLADDLVKSNPQLTSSGIIHIGPVTGAHMGPRILGVALLRKE